MMVILSVGLYDSYITCTCICSQLYDTCTYIIVGLYDIYIILANYMIFILSVANYMIFILSVGLYYIYIICRII